ncbi:hypothetical protein P153DRAFT_385731 [Dothidotthia symphoricarpi CBS 119687]|uniref:Uncharacterized protein n=1 Tax=Dothidotthia symphoricarpi CBS 119687 TaxID=1392245 RepID=A0A6A6ADA0_9PLEO|nr:uncharacterized protein P153DRAFT_385731 [Dothidotthia symphoricarpi CBS 119687]KAF2129526.1 hypothetical protein P153DRAFT_385731 [Dothidotthia symphoricarpi CBS 119687]
MSDVEKSFAFLQDGIPQWLQDVTVIQEKVTAMQNENINVVVSRSPFAERDTSSVELIRAGNLDAVVEEATPPNEPLATPLANRKRKSTSVISDRASGPSKYRPRTMVVITYDGDIQKSFELLVRAIGTGRNMLRKAKMQAKMSELAAVVGSSEDEDDDDDDDDDEVFMSKANYRPRITAMRMRAAARSGNGRGVGGNSNTPAALFETVDKTLEQAQSLCEKSAHLTLREGDCRKELDGVRKHFEELLETAKTEVTKCNAKKSQDIPESPAQDTSDTSVSSMEQPSYNKRFERMARPTPELAPQPHGVLLPMSTEIAPTTTKILHIEVGDDESDEETDFVMPPVRLTSRLTGRT